MGRDNRYTRAAALTSGSRRTTIPVPTSFLPLPRGSCWRRSTAIREGFIALIRQIFLKE
jgi:hypothetical protein